MVGCMVMEYRICCNVTEQKKSFVVREFATCGQNVAFELRCEMGGKHEDEEQYIWGMGAFVYYNGRDYFWCSEHKLLGKNARVTESKWMPHWHDGNRRA